MQIELREKDDGKLEGRANRGRLKIKKFGNGGLNRSVLKGYLIGLPGPKAEERVMPILSPANSETQGD